MKYTTPASVELLARVAAAGPLSVATPAGSADVDERNRVRALVCKLAQSGALRRVRVGVYDLGPAAPWWARKLRGERVQ